ncbi:hypothetical protein C8R42DRAFT_741530 [Lentinula raphanica]|nr:hypothetical protein C8R42DRAFT_741530 [Lentinula raphanica]KAJ3825025.1 hypothetical protein F5880DRAFT_1505770 [Lentinula raphanica]
MLRSNPLHSDLIQVEDLQQNSILKDGQLKNVTEEELDELMIRVSTESTATHGNDDDKNETAVQAERLRARVAELEAKLRDDLQETKRNVASVASLENESPEDRPGIVELKDLQHTKKSDALAVSLENKVVSCERAGIAEFKDLQDTKKNMASSATLEDKSAEERASSGELPALPGTKKEVAPLKSKVYFQREEAMITSILSPLATADMLGIHQMLLLPKPTRSNEEPHFHPNLHEHLLSIFHAGLAHATLITNDISTVVQYSFEFIVILGGTAGLAVANRLAVNHTVLVVERGEDLAAMTWSITLTALSLECCGNCLGGNSTRPTFAGMDAIEALGNPGWGWNDFLWSPLNAPAFESIAKNTTQTVFDEEVTFESRYGEWFFRK